MDRSADHLPQPWTGTKRHDLAPEEEAGRPEVFASEDEAGRPEVLAPEEEACWPKVLTLEEEAFAPNVLADEAGRPEVFMQTRRHVCTWTKKRDRRTLTRNK